MKITKTQLRKIIKEELQQESGILSDNSKERAHNMLGKVMILLSDITENSSSEDIVITKSIEARGWTKAALDLLFPS